MSTVPSVRSGIARHLPGGRRGLPMRCPLATFPGQPAARGLKTAQMGSIRTAYREISAAFGAAASRGADVPLNMLHDNQIKEHLALAYVYAVASRARCSFDTPRVDNDSVDVKLTFRNEDDEDALIRSPEIALQVKGHPVEDDDQIVNDVMRNSVPFFLKKKNYDDLIKRAQTPRLLVVVVLPKDPTSWLSIAHSELILRRCGYWINLAGQAPTENASGQTVHLPTAQIFDPQTLARLMRSAARQERLQ
jgi:hypothetical protein